MVPGPPQKRKLLLSKRAALKGTHNAGPTMLILPLLVVTVSLHVLSVVSNSLQPYDCSSPGSSAHGIFQARILLWVAISSSRGSS